jgi:hypothetical protein
MKLQKRAAIEVQFNWIFVLIAGALILVFFINISNVQRKNADQSLAFDLLSKIDLIMSGALAIPQTGQVFDMPSISFDVECSRISALGVSRQFPDRIVFAPDALSGKRLVVWSEDWNVPFKVTNFLYITTSGVRYVVVANPDDTSAQTFLNKSLPDNITKEVANLSELADKNNYKIKLIFLDKVYPDLTNDDLQYDTNYNMSLPAFIRRMPDNEVSGVYITTNSIPQKVRFIVKKGNRLSFVDPELEVYKDAMISGAAFAENLDEFNCSINKAFMKLHYVSEVYAMREQYLYNDYNGVYNFLTGCTSAGTRDYDPGTGGYINTIKSAALTHDISTISNVESYIAGENNNALRESCAPIY